MTIGSFRLNTLSAAMAAGDIVASGGTIGYYTGSGGQLYKNHSFTTAGSNSFVVTNPGAIGSIDALLIGGGGAGGGGVTSLSGWGGGGGSGAAGILSGITIVPGTYTFTVGAAGVVSASNGFGGNGGDTIAFGYTYGGGGGGGKYAGNGQNATSVSGNGVTGSGGGGGGSNTNIGTYAGGTGTYSGGTTIYSGSISTAGSGGGGATGNGSSVTNSSTKGNGGTGFSTIFTNATSITYASGGQGAAFGSNGTSGANAGSGGGGASSNTGGLAGIAGAVYIRYPIQGISSYIFVTSDTSITTSLTFPTVQAGDIVFYYNTAFNTTTTIPTQVTPTGFTNRYNTTVSTTLGGRSCMYTKICDGTESGTTITNMTGTSSTSSIILIYRPNIPLIQGITMANNGSVFADTAPTNQTVNYNLANQLGFGLQQWAASSSITSRTSGVTASREVGTSNGLLYVKVWEINNFSTSFANSTNSMADYGTNSFANNVVRIA
jgi:hypothetical protein